MASDDKQVKSSRILPHINFEPSFPGKPSFKRKKKKKNMQWKKLLYWTQLSICPIFHKQEKYEYGSEHGVYRGNEKWKLEPWKRFSFQRRPRFLSRSQSRRTLNVQQRETNGKRRNAARASCYKSVTLKIIILHKQDKGRKRASRSSGRLIKRRASVRGCCCCARRRYGNAVNGVEQRCL